MESVTRKVNYINYIKPDTIRLRIQRSEVRILSGTPRFPLVFNHLDFSVFQPESQKLSPFNCFCPRGVHAEYYAEVSAK